MLVLDQADALSRPNNDFFGGATGSPSLSVLAVSETVNYIFVFLLVGKFAIACIVDVNTISDSDQDFLTV